MIVILFLGAVFLAGVGAARAEERATVRIIYFTSAECPHCRAVFDEVLTPLQEEYGDQLQIKVVDISDPGAPGSVNAANYELLVHAEEMFDVPPEERGLPMVIVGGEALAGEDAICEQLPRLICSCMEQGGTPWPDIPGLADVASGLAIAGPDIGFNPGSESIELCEAEEAAVCEAPAPIWVAYFYEVGCQECSRAEYDIRYGESKYPQVVVEEYNVQGDAALAEWLGARLGVPEAKRLATPALFVGDDYLIGPEITSEAVVALAEKYAASGAERVWNDFDPEEAQRSIVERFQSFGTLTVAFAGLVDGLNPCAFATLCFFVSYLALSGRQGREVLATGVAFTLGVFLAYLAVGLGFYQVLDLLGGLLTTLGRWVYGLTGLLCAVLAVLSLLDLLKARRSGIRGMVLNLPHALRMRINAVIRKGRHSRAFVAGSFFTGVVVSFLELACTGQVYLPTIVFVVSQPEMRVRGLLFLILYNSDNWFLRRIMKLTSLEKRLINSPQHARHTERTALALLEHIQLPPEPHCLEVGCGQGALARLLVECYGAQVVASDYDPAQVALAQERLADLGGHIEFRVVDARDMPFDGAQFDALFSFGVLHHIPGGWRKAVTEIARVLKPGGWFVFTDLVVTPRAGRWLRRLLARLDQLEEAALQGCLAEHSLRLEHYAYGQGELMAVLGLMGYCTAVARRSGCMPSSSA